jgi:hypothetical protein
MELLTLDGGLGFLIGSICLAIEISLTYILAIRLLKTKTEAWIVYAIIALCGYLLASFAFTNYSNEDATFYLAILAASSALFFRVFRVKTFKQALPAELERVIKEFRATHTNHAQNRIKSSDEVRLAHEVILGAGLLYQNAPGKLAKLGYTILRDTIFEQDPFLVVSNVKYSDCEAEIRHVCKFVVLHDGKYLSNSITKL